MKKIFKALAITATAAAMCVGVGVAAGCNGAEQKLIGSYHYISSYGPEYGMVVEVTVKNNIITGIKDITNDANNEDVKRIQTYKDVAMVDGKKVEGVYDSDNKKMNEGEAYMHEWHAVSQGWESYFYDLTHPNYWVLTPGSWIGMDADKLYYKNLEEGHEGEFIEWDGKTVPAPEATNIGSYGWTDDNNKEWTDHTSWLLDQYIGWSVADILDLNVYTDYGYSFAGADGSVAPVLDKNTKGEPYKVSYNASLNDSGLLISGATQGSGRLLLAVQDALSK